jgi:hypothetical protein
MKRQRLELSLRIEHPSCDLAPVCDAIGLRPTRIWKKGDVRRTPKGTEPGGTYDKSTCTIVFASASRKSLSEQLKAALQRLKPHRSTLRKISSSGGIISLYVAWFCDEHTGERLAWQILKDAADLQVSLDLNIYIPDQPDAESS